jgi:hypothetical protein
MTTTNSTATRARNLESPDDRRDLRHGRLDIVELPEATIVRATFEPGFRWSTDMALAAGTPSCQTAHLGVVLAGRFHIRMDDGTEVDLGPGDAHAVAPGHDAWVVGDDPVDIIDVAPTVPAAGGKVARCPCGVEFRVADDGGLDHLVAAVQQHAAGSHGHAPTREHILAEITAG